MSSDNEDIESLVSSEDAADGASTGSEPMPPMAIESDGDDDDDDDDEVMIRLENDVDRDYLLEFHPEVQQANFSEIQAQAVVVRAKNGDVIDPLHKTLPVLSRYERARVLGLRSKQLNNGADPFVKVPDDMIDGYAIALEELKQKKVPFIIRRPLPNGASEYWRVSDLELIDY